MSQYRLVRIENGCREVQDTFLSQSPLAADLRFTAFTENNHLNPSDCKIEYRVEGSRFWVNVTPVMKRFGAYRLK